MIRQQSWIELLQGQRWTHELASCANLLTYRLCFPEQLAKLHHRAGLAPLARAAALFVVVSAVPGAPPFAFGALSVAALPVLVANAPAQSPTAIPSPARGHTLPGASLLKLVSAIATKASALVQDVDPQVGIPMAPSFPGREADSSCNWGGLPYHSCSSGVAPGLMSCNSAAAEFAMAAAGLVAEDGPGEDPGVAVAHAGG